MVKSSKSTATKSRSSNKSKSRARSRSSGDRSRSGGRSRSKTNDRRPIRSSDSPRAGTSSGSRRDVEKTKRPMNGYTVFIKEKMANRKFAKGQCIEEMKNLAKLWKAMSEDEKKKYKAMAEEANRNSGTLKK